MKTKKIRLRRAHSRDAEFLREIFNTPIIMEVFDLQPSTMERWSRTLKDWQEDDLTSPYIVETVAALPVKMGLLVAREDKKDEKLIRLEKITLAPNFWGSGDAHLAMEAFHDICAGEGRERVRLGVNKENKWAQKFFEKNGYSVCGERIETFGDRQEQQARYIMEKFIPPRDKTGKGLGN